MMTTDRIVWSSAIGNRRSLKAFRSTLVDPIWEDQAEHRATLNGPNATLPAKNAEAALHLPCNMVGKNVAYAQRCQRLGISLRRRKSRQA